MSKTKTKPLEGWVNVYEGGIGLMWKSQAQADSHAVDGRLQCVHVREVREKKGESNESNRKQVLEVPDVSGPTGI